MAVADLHCKTESFMLDITVIERQITISLLHALPPTIEKPDVGIITSCDSWFEKYKLWIHISNITYIGQSSCYLQCLRSVHSFLTKTCSSRKCTRIKRDIFICNKRFLDQDSWNEFCVLCELDPRYILTDSDSANGELIVHEKIIKLVSYLKHYIAMEALYTYRQ